MRQCDAGGGCSGGQELPEKGQRGRQAIFGDAVAGASHDMAIGVKTRRRQGIGGQTHFREIHHLILIAVHHQRPVPGAAVVAHVRLTLHAGDTESEEGDYVQLR